MPSAHPGPCLPPLCPLRSMLSGPARGASPELCSFRSFCDLLSPGRTVLGPRAVSTGHYLSGACVGLGAFGLDRPSLPHSSSSPCFRHSSSTVPARVRSSEHLGFLRYRPVLPTVVRVLPSSITQSAYEVPGIGLRTRDKIMNSVGLVVGKGAEKNKTVIHTKPLKGSAPNSS